MNEEPLVNSASSEDLADKVEPGSVEKGPDYGHSFSSALEHLKNVQYARITRAGWNRKGMWVEAQLPDEGSKNTRPYLVMVVPPNTTDQFGDEGEITQRVPWAPSQTDLFACDWQMLV